MFDPYEKRVSRDIRNQLSEEFLHTLAGGNWTSLEETAAALRSQAPDTDHTGFIDHRMADYRKVYKKSAGKSRIEIAWDLWDLDLFFECHEWVEDLWGPAQGETKKALQGIIRTAGAHVLAEAGRTAPAISSAHKAMDLISTHSALIPVPFNPDELTEALNKLIRENG